MNLDVCVNVVVVLILHASFHMLSLAPRTQDQLKEGVKPFISFT